MLFSGLAISDVELMFAQVAAATQYSVNFLDTPRHAAHQVAALCQMFDDLFDAERSALIAVQIEVVDLANNQGFARFDFQALLFSAPTPGNIRGDGFEAKRWARSTKKALPDVLTHGAVGMLGVLATLVFVEEVDDTAHHFAAGVIGRGLRDGNDLDLVLTEFALIKAEFEPIAEETRQAVNHDGVVGRGFG